MMNSGAPMRSRLPNSARAYVYSKSPEAVGEVRLNCRRVIRGDGSRVTYCLAQVTHRVHPVPEPPPRYGAPMTTAVKAPFADASPAQIREAILPEDRPEFDRQWRDALNAAADALSLDEVHATLESWRRVAWLVTAHGPEGYRRMMATAEQTLRTRQSLPGAASWEQVKARFGL